MTKALYLLRHAKSSWADATLSDHDRPLQAKGERRAGRMRDYLAENGIRVDLVLCSSALRARQTYDIVAPALGQAELQIDERIYGVDVDDAIALLREVDERYDNVMLVGHDPTLRLLAMTLAMTATGDARDRIDRKFPTSGLAFLTIGDASWGALSRGIGHLEAFHVPEDEPVA
ncbi:MAG: histidine phosphatase family protein [Pseudomonadota bacterium]